MFVMDHVIKSFSILLWIFILFIIFEDCDALSINVNVNVNVNANVNANANANVNVNKGKISWRSCNKHSYIPRSFATTNEIQTNDDNFQESRPFSYQTANDDKSAPKTESLLTYATHNIIYNIPHGSLSRPELESIPGLMAAWTKKNQNLSKTNAEIALIVEQLIKRVIDERKAGNKNARATTRMYNMMIDAWSKSGKKGYAARRCQSILDRMEQMYLEGELYIKPNSYTYNAVLNAWSKSGEKDSSMNAEMILKRMIKYQTQPDVFTYTTVIDTLKGGGRYSAFRALEILKQMQTENIVKPNTYTYTTIINVLAKSGDYDSGDTCIALLDYMMELYKNYNDIESKPNIVTCNGVLLAISRAKGIHNASKIEDLLQRMKLPMEQNGFHIPPDNISYNIAILYYCWKNISTLDSISRAISLLQEMKDNQIQPTLNQYNVIIIALSKIHHHKSAKMADSLLQQMIQESIILPDTVTFNACMSSYARNRGLAPAHRVEELITQMYTLHKSGTHPDLKPNLRSFAAVLQTWARSGLREKAAIRAEEIIHRMEMLYEEGELDSPPDVYCYTIVITAWANSYSIEAGKRSLQLLDRMKEMYKRGYNDVKPNVRTYNAVIDTMYRCPNGNPKKAEELLRFMIQKYKEGDMDLQPDSFSFHACIQCYTKSNDQYAGDKAISLLEEMLQLRNDGILQTDRRIFSHISEWYAKNISNQAPEKAKQLLHMQIDIYQQDLQIHNRHNEKIMPNSFAFKNIMMMYTKTSQNAGTQNEQLLQLLQNFYQITECNPKCKPNIFLYNCVLEGYYKSGELRFSAKKANDILTFLEQQYQNGYDDLRPTSKTYIYTMSCYAKSREMGKARKTLNVLRRMQKQYDNGNPYTQPNVQAYSLVINAAAFTNHEDVEEEKEALDVAKIAMKELDECPYDNPNSITYGSFMKVCANLNLPKDTLEQEAKIAFLKCCENGQLNEYVLSQFKYAVSDSLFKEIIPNWDQLSDEKNNWNKNLPKEWSRNVPVKLLYDTRGNWWRSNIE